MNLKPSAVLTTATLAVAVVLSSCTDAALEKPAAAATNLGNQLTLTGRVCTQPPNPGGFPVKVLFLVDQSGSMCISDPPGSQGVAGLCEELVTLGIVPANLTTPARVRAIESLLAQFQDEITNQGANITVSIVPFATNVQNPYPAEGTTPSFVTPFGLTGYLSALQGQLGKGTDDQGALSYAYTVIAGDVAATAASDPALLPRTRYVIVWLTDGTPYPRCSAIDNLPEYADPQHPYLIWADSVPDYCNEAGATGGDPINGLDPSGNDSLCDAVPGRDECGPGGYGNAGIPLSAKSYECIREGSVAFIVGAGGTLIATTPIDLPGAVVIGTFGGLVTDLACETGFIP